MTTYYKAVRPDGTETGPAEFGPQEIEVAAIIERARRLTGDEASRLIAAQRVEWYPAWRAAMAAEWDAGCYAEWDAAWATAGNDAWGAAGAATWDAVRYVVRDTLMATLTRDLITPEQYDTLMAPWREVIGNA